MSTRTIRVIVFFVCVALAAIVALPAGSGARSTSVHATVPRCNFSDLRITKGRQRHTPLRSHLAIVFVNRSHHTCKLRGFPDVYTVGSHGDQLGGVAIPNNRVATLTVVLQPGSPAHSDYTQTDGRIFDPTDCHPVWSSFLQVFPPGSSGGWDRSGEAVYLPWAAVVCTAHSAADSSVRPVRPGRG